MHEPVSSISIVNLTTSGDMKIPMLYRFGSTLNAIEDVTPRDEPPLNSNDRPVNILFFAALRGRAGTRSVDIAAFDGMTVDDAVLVARKAAPKDPEPGTTVMLALNGEYVKGDQPVKAGDEIALIPPVSGGSGDIKTDSDWVFVTSEELNAAPLTEFVTTGVDGAVVTFLGVTRDHNEGRKVEYLDYEAYQPMAENKIAELISEMRSKCGSSRGVSAPATGIRVGALFRRQTERSGPDLEERTVRRWGSLDRRDPRCRQSDRGNGVVLQELANNRAECF
jgi:molybdopterin converting factor subunit 1